MKEVASSLEEYLNTTSNFISCDLYEWQLSDGSIYYFADTDRDLNVGGNTYKHNALLISREQVKLHSSLVVDNMTITISTSPNDTIAGKQILLAAHDGTLDQSKLSLKRVFFEGTEIKGIISLFAGNVEVKSAGGIKLQLTVKSKAQGLNMEYPIRKYYPQGTYSINSNQVISDDALDETCLIAPFVPRKEVLI